MLLNIGLTVLGIIIGLLVVLRISVIIVKSNERKELNKQLAE
jgi:hypothetical protein